jgi:hypothetical protein
VIDVLADLCSARELFLERVGAGLAGWLPFENSEPDVLKLFNASSLNSDNTNAVTVGFDAAKKGNDTSGYASIDVFAALAVMKKS